MKIMGVVLCAGLGWPILSGAEDMRTLSGQTYSNIVVQQFDDEGCSIRHEGGTNGVPWRDISAELRGHYKALSQVPIPAARLAGEKEAPAGPDDLETVSGQIYRNVVLKEVREDSILIAHESGMATVSFLAIPRAQHGKYRTGTPVVPDPPPGMGDLVANSGQVFRGVEILLHEPDGLTFRHEGGVTKLGFPALSEELRQQYKYDPVEGWKYGRDQVARKDQARQEAENESQGPPLVEVFDVRGAALPDKAYQVAFSLKNRTEEAQSVTISLLDSKRVALMTRTIELTARAEGKPLKLDVPEVQPQALAVACGTYRTNCVLSW